MNNGLLPSLLVRAELSYCLVIIYQIVCNEVRL